MKYYSVHKWLANSVLLIEMLRKCMNYCYVTLKTYLCIQRKEHINIKDKYQAMKVSPGGSPPPRSCCPLTPVASHSPCLSLPLCLASCPSLYSGASDSIANLGYFRQPQTVSGSLGSLRQHHKSLTDLATLGSLISLRQPWEHLAARDRIGSLWQHQEPQSTSGALGALDSLESFVQPWKPQAALLPLLPCPLLLLPLAILAPCPLLALVYEARGERLRGVRD